MCYMLLTLSSRHLPRLASSNASDLLHNRRQQSCRRIGIRYNRQNDIIFVRRTEVDVVLPRKLLKRSNSHHWSAYIGSKSLLRKIQVVSKTYLSVSELCWNIPEPCVSPLATSKTSLLPGERTTFVGQISTSTGYTSPGSTGRTSVE